MLSLSPRPSHPHVSRDESGYVLLAVIFLTFMLLLTLAIAAPKIATSIQRQKEIETVHRGEQYKRAIQLYYRKFGQYPATVDQLVNTNNIRFLRKRYIDPLTGKDDWKIVYFGQAHVRPLGFFGQPLGTGVAGGLAGASIISSSMYAAVPTNPDGSPAATDSSGSAVGTAPAATQPGAGMGTGPSMAGNPMGFGSSGTSGFGSSQGSIPGSSPGSGFGSSMTPGMSPTGVGATSTSPFGGSPGGSSGTTFGGGGFIVGVTLPVKKPSLLAYKKQTNYNQWEFNYDPMEDQMNSVAGVGGGAGNLNGTPATGAMPGVGSPGGGIGAPGAGIGAPGSSMGGTSPTTGPTGSSGPSFGGASGTSGSGSSGDSGGSSDSGSTPPSAPPQ